jgi:hypothetical protein
VKCTKQKGKEKNGFPYPSLFFSLLKEQHTEDGGQQASQIKGRRHGR